MTVQILIGDVRARLADLAAQSIHCIVTSPPYFGLRSYGTEPQIWSGDAACEHVWADATMCDSRHYPEHKPSEKQGTNAGSHQRGVKPGDFCARCAAWRGELGLEPTVDLYIEHMVDVFRAARRVLRDDGTLWLNIGDSYAGSWGAQSRRVTEGDDPSWHSSQIKNHPKRSSHTGTIRSAGAKPKDLYGIPWMLAFALRADGWYLRQDIIWSKPNPMPESVTDRCTKAHEYLFLMTKSERYYYDAEAIKEPAIAKTPGDFDGGPQRLPDGSNANAGRNYRTAGNKSNKYVTAYEASDTEEHRTKAGLMKVADVPWERRNRRSVWSIATAPFADSHFATFPQALVDPCILAGSPHGGTALDPFGGSGTVGVVADRLGRNAILIELNPEYAAMARRRVDSAAPERRQLEGDDRHSAVISAKAESAELPPLLVAMSAAPAVDATP